MTNVNTFEELFAELDRDAEFRKEYRRQKPYYDLILEIVRRRNELKLTQKELAEKVGTHQSHISRIEAGEHNTKLSTLIEIAEALEAKVEIKLVPIFYVKDEEYANLFDTSANNEPKGTHTTTQELSGEIAGI